MNKSAAYSLAGASLVLSILSGITLNIVANEVEQMKDLRKENERLRKIIQKQTRLAKLVKAAYIHIYKVEGFAMCPFWDRNAYRVGLSTQGKHCITQATAHGDYTRYAEHELEYLLSKFSFMTDEQLIAIFSRVFNVGRPTFMRSKLYRALLINDKYKACFEWSDWEHPNRTKYERNLFSCREVRNVAS